MQANDASWEPKFDRWMGPFFQAFRHKSQRQWAPYYLRGLLLPGERKSIEPMAARVCPHDTQQLHHFISTSPWDPGPLEAVLLEKVDGLVGSDDAYLIVDDTALVKKGDRSVGVAHQYCGQLGKNANCQALVSITLARDEMPVPVALRLYLPQSWIDDVERRRECGVPESIGFRTKGDIALAEIDRVREGGARFGTVLADAGYGASAEFRHALSERGLTWAVGISSKQSVYPASVRLHRVEPSNAGRPRKHGTPSFQRRSVKAMVASMGKKAWQTISWRDGTKGPLECEFAALRVHVADGPLASRGVRLPGELAWLVAERRRSGETKYYLTNHSDSTSLFELAAAIKARWSCEQVHQQLKEELGLDHFEGRSWNGLHHHALMTMISFAFLQHLRVHENKFAA